MSLDKVVDLKIRDRRRGGRPFCFKERRAKRLEVAELMVVETCEEKEREEEIVTPRHEMESTRGILIRGGGGGCFFSVKN